jgi:hypothetical protein
MTNNLGEKQTNKPLTILWENSILNIEMVAQNLNILLRNTLFTNASAFVSVNNALSLKILLHHSICQGCSLATYLYVLTADSLGYLLEAAHIAGQVCRILLLDGSEMVNSHFADDSLLSLRVEQRSVDGALACLDTFCFASSTMVSAYKTNFWFVELDSPPNWIPAA